MLCHTDFFSSNILTLLSQVITKTLLHSQITFSIWQQLLSLPCHAVISCLPPIFSSWQYLDFCRRAFNNGAERTPALQRQQRAIPFCISNFFGRRTVHKHTCSYFCPAVSSHVPLAKKCCFTKELCLCSQSILWYAAGATWRGIYSTLRIESVDCF